MASSVTFDTGTAGRDCMGDRYIRRGTITLGTYATGGVAVTRAQLDLAHSLVDLRLDPAAGYQAVVTSLASASATVKVYTPVKTYTATYDPASLGATTARDDAITVTGVAATDIVVGYQAAPALTSGLTAQEVRVSGADTITVRLNNASAGSIDGASGTWTFYVAKANGALTELADTTDLSAVSFRFKAEGK